MWYTKKCPRCSGDMYTEWDNKAHEVDLRCLQCGYSKPLKKRETLPFTPTAGRSNPLR